MNVRVTRRESPQRTDTYAGIVRVEQVDDHGTVAFYTRQGETLRRVAILPYREGQTWRCDNDGAVVT